MSDEIQIDPVKVDEAATDITRALYGRHDYITGILALKVARLVLIRELARANKTTQDWTEKAVDRLESNFAISIRSGPRETQ